MRSIGMDVHRSFAQVAVLDRGKVTEKFRVALNGQADPVGQECTHLGCMTRFAQRHALRQ